MAPKIETFDINHAQKAFEIKTKSGIILKFPENAFSDAMGNPVLGNVQLSVQHFQSKSDFASAGLTSSTTDGQALESGGMIDINATSGNASIRIADGKSYKMKEIQRIKRVLRRFMAWVAIKPLGPTTPIRRMPVPVITHQTVMAAKTRIGNLRYHCFPSPGPIMALPNT